MRCCLAFVTALVVFLPGLSAAQQDHVKSKESVAKTAPEKKTRSALKPADGASIKIIAPTKNQVFKGDQVPVHFKLAKGKRGHHAHAYVDGELMGMFESEKGTLNGVKPGKHILEFRVIANDHTTELDASDKVEFTVR